MRNSIIPVLVTASAMCVFAQVETSILKQGRTWVYAYEKTEAMTGAGTTFRGTAEFRIDSVIAIGTWKVEYRVSRKDTGFYVESGQAAGTRTEKSHFLEYGKFIADIPGGPVEPPIFAYGGPVAKPLTWAVLGTDTLRLTISDQTGLSRCNPVAFRYLESVGLIEYSKSTHCGITSEDISYRLTFRDGIAFSGQDVRVLPGIGDFAPYEMGKFWEYLVVQQNSGLTGMTSQHRSTRDSLKWSFQVVQIAKSGFDSLVELRVSITGRKGIGVFGVISPGVPVDIGYTDSTLFRNGGMFPAWEGNRGWSYIDGYPKFSPFFDSHNASWVRPSPGAWSRDTSIAGTPQKVLKFERKKDSFFEPEWKGLRRFAQGVGLTRGEYGGYISGTPRTGSSDWSGSIILVETGVRPVGIHSRGDGGVNAGRSMPAAGLRTGSVWLSGRWFGVDGRQKAFKR